MESSTKSYKCTRRGTWADRCKGEIAGRRGGGGGAGSHRDSAELQRCTDMCKQYRRSDILCKVTEPTPAGQGDRAGQQGRAKPEMLTCCSETALALSLFNPCSLHIQAIASHGGPRQAHDYTRGRGLIYAVTGERRGPDIILEIIWTNDYFVVVAGECDRWRILSLMCSLLGFLA